MTTTPSSIDARPLPQRTDRLAERWRSASPAAAEQTFSVNSRRPSPAQALATARERRFWNRRAGNWDDASVGLSSVVNAVLLECRAAGPDVIAVDLGAGSGAVTIPLARTSRRVLAVDISEKMLARLRVEADQQGIHNIDVLPHSLETFELAPSSLDLVVSNYTLHHLRDADKARLLKGAHTWLKPGGRVVIGDMMFGRAMTVENRRIIAGKAAVFLRRGPAGWVRLAKNVVRFALRVQEKPLSPDAWVALAHAAGFTDVRVVRVVSEASVLVATKPAVGSLSAEPGGERPSGS